MKELISLSINGNSIDVPKTLPQPGSGVVSKVIGNAIEIFIIAGITVSVIMIIWAGIQWATSGGEKEKISAARARMTWAIVGVIIMLLSFGIVNLFGYFFKVNLFNLSF